MSFLREAEKCLLNQKTFATLNAFITPLERSTSWRDRVQAADSRRDDGEIPDSIFLLLPFPRPFLLISIGLT